MTTPPTLTDQQIAELKPLAAVITKALQETPVRLGSNDWADSLSAELVVRIAAYVGRTLGPDARILGEIQAERERQDASWGPQNHPDGTGGIEARRIAEDARRNCQAAAERGTVTWLLISDEEHCEALAESDPVKLRAELVQDAAVKVAWIAAIDRRTTNQPAA